MESQIVSYCRISNEKIVVDGEIILSNSEHKSGGEFLSEAYRTLELGYAKFFKMDLLCKLGIIASELVLRRTAKFNFDKTKTGMIFANRSSSLDTDRTHAASIADKQHYFPSPSVFVYTLPNIVTGEIAIKHGLTGENAFFISDRFDGSLFSNYAQVLFAGPTETLLCGWVEAEGGTLDGLVYSVKKTIFGPSDAAKSVAHEIEQINKLYAI